MDINDQEIADRLARIRAQQQAEDEAALSRARSSGGGQNGTQSFANSFTGNFDPTKFAAGLGGSSGYAGGASYGLGSTGAASSALSGLGGGGTYASGAGFSLGGGGAAAGGASGGAAGAAGSSGLGGSLAAAGPWAALAAAIFANEKSAKDGGYRREGADYAKDLATGRVLYQDVDQRWAPKIFGHSDKTGMGGDMRMASALGSLQPKKAWEHLTEDSSIAKIFKKIF